MAGAAGAGRAFGQRLGKLLEDEIHCVVQDAIYGSEFEFIAKGKLRDLHGKPCEHDGLVTDVDGRPYAVIESKIIQKAKHATEKAAKVAREHPDLKRAHPTLRASIAVLAGAFTPEPLRMVESSGANLLFIPQQHLVTVCRRRGIEILWQDHEAVTFAARALEQYNALKADQRKILGQELLKPVAEQLRQIILQTLADAEPNPVVKVWLDIFYKRGEIAHQEFPAIPAALEYLTSWSE